MHDYLRRIGYQPADLNKLNVVHITGTKGKGSTSAFTERILRSHLKGSVGLYTSPHLCAVRERIRVDGEPLSEELFARFFFEVWEKLERDTSVSLRPVALDFLSRGCKGYAEERAPLRWS